MYTMLCYKCENFVQRPRILETFDRVRREVQVLTDREHQKTAMSHGMTFRA